MEFENILKDVGDFGFYQKFLIVIFIVPATLIIPWVSMNAVFVSSTPDHWCHVPELDPLGISVEDQKRLVRPPDDPFCTRYDINYTKFLQSGNQTVDINSPVRSCDSGWMYDTTYYDETAVTKWNLVCEDNSYKSMIVSFVFVGVIIGTPFYGFLSDKYGRKNIFLGLSLVVSLAEMASAFCPYFSVFLFLRVVIGSTISSLYNLAYIMILELVKPGLRARINGITTNCWTLGMCLLAAIAYVTRSWVNLSIVVSVATGSFLLFVKILPESPSWLVSQERYEEAAHILERIAKMNKKEIKATELVEMLQTLGTMKQKENSEKASPLDFLKYPALRKRFFLSILVGVGLSIPYYGLQVNALNLSGNEFFNFFILSIIELPAHLITWWMLSRLGRKKSIEIAFIVSATSSFATLIFHGYPNVDVFASIFAKAGASAAFMVMYQLGPELFPTSHRGVGMGMTSTLGTGSTLIVPYIVQLEKYGSHIPLLVFGLTSILAAFLAVFLPETAGKNLPQSVDDVEEAGKNEKCFHCGLFCNDDYDLEERNAQPRPKACSIPGIIPVYALPGDMKELSPMAFMPYYKRRKSSCAAA